MNFDSFGLANFKAFGPTLQHVPIKPITLVFGPNSSGKSSLLHGLVWAAEATEQKSFDIRSSKRVSDTLDLGGFESVVRKHDPQNKVALSIGFGSTPSGAPVRIVLEIGIRTASDSWEAYEREWLTPQDRNEIEEFHTTGEVVGRAAGLLGLAFVSGEDCSTANVKAALATDSAWEHLLDKYRRYWDEYEYDVDVADLPEVNEARALYREAQRAWKRRRELAPKIIPLLKAHYQKFGLINSAESRAPTLLSCRVWNGDKSIFNAARKLSSSSLTVDPKALDRTTWEEILGREHSNE